MNRLLFVVRNYSGIGAQPIRFRQIIGHLSPENEVHVLELTHDCEGVRYEAGITIHTLRYSRIGRILNPRVAAISPAGKGAGKGKSVARIKRFVRSILFPDSLVTEALRLRNSVLRLAGDLDCDAVIVSAFPFTTLVCLKALKEKMGTKTVLDAGDPFYKNSKNGLIKDLLAREFEKHYLKYADSLVVTNKVTREHYLNSFPEQLQPDRVKIIPQGVSESFLGLLRKERRGISRTDHGGQIIIVYAGQLYRRMREPFELYRAVTEMSNDNTAGPGIVLHMYGSYSREFVAGYGNSGCIVFQGHISQEKLTDVYLNSDAVIFLDNAYGMQTPGKIFEIALLGRPVLFISDREQSPAREVIKDLDHFVITENKSGKIIPALRKVLSDNICCYKHADVAEEFLWETRAASYNELLTGLIAEKES